MAYRSSREALQKLHALASHQGGYFTAKQAGCLGYEYPHLSYHTRAGNLERAGHGVYRLVTVPISEHDDLVRLACWSHDRQGRSQAVVSHASALVLHGLTLLLPRVIHLSVPPRFQKRPPPGCKLHRTRFGEEDVREHDGFLMTEPLRTISDVASELEHPEEDLLHAVTVGMERGLFRREALKRLCDRLPGSRLERALAWAEPTKPLRRSRPRSRTG